MAGLRETRLDETATGKTAALAEKKIEPPSRGEKNTSARSPKEVSHGKWEAKHAAEVREHAATKKKHDRVRSGARDVKHRAEFGDAEFGETALGGCADVSCSSGSGPQLRQVTCLTDGAMTLAERLNGLQHFSCAADKRKAVLKVLMGNRKYHLSCDPSEVLCDLQARQLVDTTLFDELVALIKVKDVAMLKAARPPEEWLEHAKQVADMQPLDGKPFTPNEIAYLTSIDQKHEELARLKLIEERRQTDAEALAWMDAAARRPAWNVPTSIKLTSCSLYQDCLLGTYYHAPEAFNVDVYKKMEFRGGSFLYYRASPESEGWTAKAGWHLSCGIGTTRRDGPLDPKGEPGGTLVSGARWVGDGSHYLVSGDPPWTLEFGFEHDAKSRRRIDWDRWEETKGCKKQVPLLQISEVTTLDLIMGVDDLMQDADFSYIRRGSTGISYDITIFDNARIPSMTVEVKDEPGVAVSGADLSETRSVVVQMLTGVVATLDVPSPHKVKLAKDMLASRLGIPVFLQQLMHESTELVDDDLISVASLLLVRKEPPMISVREFLETIAFCPAALDSVPLQLSQAFRMSFPWLKESGIEQTMYEAEIAMQSENAQTANQVLTGAIPLSTAGILKCFDVWFGVSCTYPDALLTDLDRLVAFFEHYCYSPSVYSKFHERQSADDSAWYYFFMMGRLRHESETLFVVSISLGAHVE